jgi:probable F420-dependent oxidoreductase
MKIGATFPTTEIGADRIAIRDFAQAAEQLGYERLHAFDHVLGPVHTDRDPPLPVPYDETHNFHEPLVLHAYLAALTTTIELATSILVLPQRQTVLVAKQAAEVAIVSDGRLNLGVGIGWSPVEYEALGVSMEQRGQRLEEQVALLRELWAAQVVDYAGNFDRVDRASLLPRPLGNSIPIWFGGSSYAAIERAARLADGFVFPFAGEPTLRLAEQLQDLVATRHADPFPIDAFVSYESGEDEWTAAREAWDGPERMLSLNSMSTTPGDHTVGTLSPSEHIRALERFAEAMLPNS